MHGRLELCLQSEQVWALPLLLAPLRWALGGDVRARVTTTLVVDVATGRVVAVHDRVRGWPVAPAALRVALGLTVPLAVALLPPP